MTIESDKTPQQLPNIELPPGSIRINPLDLQQILELHPNASIGDIVDILKGKYTPPTDNTSPHVS